MSPLVSIIIPVYKSENNLQECLDSILNQTYKKFELILVDDGSPDSSPEICDEYSRTHDCIKVIHKKNGGVSSARNEGLKVSKGDFITFVDSDDYIDSNFLEMAINFISKYDIDLYISGLKMEYYKDNKIVNSESYHVKESKCYSPLELLNRFELDYPQICICGPCCKLYSSKMLKNNNICFDQTLSLGEDTYFNLDVLKYTNKIYFDSNIYYHYRRGNDESLFSKFNPNIYVIHYKVYSKMLDLMTDLKCDNLSTFYKTYVNMILSCVHHFYIHPTSKKEKKNLIKQISKDKILKKCDINAINDNKTKLVLLLLKFNQWRIVYSIFNLKYRR